MSDIEVLKVIKKYSSKTNRCAASQIANDFNNVDILPNLQSLKNNEYISVYLGGDIVLHQKGFDLLRRVKKEKITKSLKIIYSIAKWLFGILTSIITAYFIFKLGLN